MQTLTNSQIEAGIQHSGVGSRTIDVGRGHSRGEVSAQWMNRPDDQKFLSLGDLQAQVRQWADESSEHDFDLAAVQVLGDDGLQVKLPTGHTLRPSNFAFGQLCSQVGAPARYLRHLPPQLAAINLEHGLHSDDGQARAYVRQNGDNMLRGITSPSYGRILDADVVQAVRNVAGQGTGDTSWKVPGVIDWASWGHGGVQYNPNVDVTKDTTTLYASDRDVFIFLVDDRNPIEIGKLANGEPDLLFRGFYAWNSEVGARTCGIATMYLRGICQNRCLWGVEGFQEVTIRHTSQAPARFVQEHTPALESFANASVAKLQAGMQAARDAVVATDDEEALDFLGRRTALTKAQATKVLELHVAEEHRPARNVWDMAQGITALARSVPHQDARLTMERQAGKLLDKVAA